MKALAYLSLSVLALALTSRANAQIFYDNTNPSGISASFLSTDEIADDTPFSGTQHVAAFAFVYLNQTSGPISATVRFYNVDPVTGGAGSLVATVPVSNLPAGSQQQLYTVNIDPSLQFDWTATPGIYKFPTVAGGFVSIQFNTPSSGWYEASGTSLDGFYDLTTGQFITFQDSSASFYLQISNSAMPSALSSLLLNPVTVKGGATVKATVTLTGPAPAGGAVVTLRSSKPNVAQVRSTATIPAGATTLTVPVKTLGVTTSTRVNISAAYAGLTKVATLVVTP
ncbi:MAG: hypothetical protein H0X25_20770 [Acidobacteriales bacterium]|nr:hypothetical protein [Terriglobales bacterium]